MNRNDVTGAWRMALACTPDGWDVGLVRHDGSFEAWAGPTGEEPEIETQANNEVSALVALTASLLRREGAIV